MIANDDLPFLSLTTAAKSPSLAPVFWSYGIAASMSRKGNCYDNAPVESFWATLKTELVHHRRYRTRAEAARDIAEYIDLFYDRQRRQARLGYVSPAAFTRQFMRQLAAA